jgi:hypothetical protein
LLQFIHEVESRQKLFYVDVGASDSNNGAISHCLLDGQFVGQDLSPGSGSGLERRIVGRLQRINCGNFLD